jgi:predicted ATPase
MLTRLKVKGFKSLLDVDVRFGPLTCIAGANGAGKSNLFDAIAFMSALADRPLLDAALGVRDDGTRRGTDIRDLFYRSGDYVASEMAFEAEMIIPRTGTDDLGQPAEATITFVRYEVRLRLRDSANSPLELVSESLEYIKLGDLRERSKKLGFPINKLWSDSVLAGQRTTHFISTEKGKIKLHQDNKGSGRATSFSAASLPRTILSGSNGAETPTVLLARREMQSWRQLQLEPSMLRKPSEFTAPMALGSNGAHLPAMLNQLSKDNPDVFVQLTNELNALIQDVRDLWVDVDDTRQIYALKARMRDGSVHSARALSEGTLRFIALAALGLDPTGHGVICFEEPENGIHPSRLQAMLDLLRSIAVDTNYAVDADNPLRQVIVNTHSPQFVQISSADDLLATNLVKSSIDGVHRGLHTQFLPLPDTWRTKVTDVVKRRVLISKK